MRHAGAAVLALVASTVSIGGDAGAPRQRYAATAPTIAPVPMKASCLPEASADVDLGAAWLLVDEAGHARAAFDRAVDRDPDCALGYWGQAIARLDEALAETPDRGVGATASGTAIEATIGRALAVPAKTTFERASVAALRAMRDRVAAPGVPAAWPARVGAYRDALCAGAASDRATRLWCARALADAALSSYTPGPAAAALAHVVELGRDRPLDVGSAFIVLQVAEDRRAPIVTRAIEAITAANPPAPWPHLAVADAAMARGDWATAASSSARASAVADDASARRRANDAELEALMQLGRRRDAYARAAVMRVPRDARAEERELAARAYARIVIADRRIDGRGLGDRTALSLGPDEATHWPAVFVDALDAALRAWPGGDATLLAKARASLETLQGLAREESAHEIDWASTIVQAAMAASQDEHQQMELFLTHAAELETDPRLMRIGSRVLVPTKEIAAELWLRTYRYDWAKRDAQAVLKAEAGRISPYVVLARTADRLHDAAGAAEAWKKVLELRATADADDTIRLEAQRALDQAK